MRQSGRRRSRRGRGAGSTAPGPPCASIAAGNPGAADGLSARSQPKGAIHAQPQVRHPLEDLFAETLKDVYFAEKQILRALPKMAKEATTPELKTAFETHRDETEGQIKRLNQVFELMGKPARGKTCEAIVGIIDEAKENMEDFSGSQALDPALVASAQTVQHYEIARYGALKA